MRTTTPPTLNNLPLLLLLLLLLLLILLLLPGAIENNHSTNVESPYPPQRVYMGIHIQGEPCSYLDRVLVLNAPPPRRRRRRWRRCDARRGCTGSCRGAHARHGLTFGHFSAQSEPFLSLRSTETTQCVPQNVFTSSQKVEGCYAPSARRCGAWVPAWAAGRCAAGRCAAAASSTARRCPGTCPWPSLPAASPTLGLAEHPIRETLIHGTLNPRNIESAEHYVGEMFHQQMLLVTS